jgi:hypothetical protein
LGEKPVERDCESLWMRRFAVIAKKIGSAEKPVYDESIG